MALTARRLRRIESFDNWKAAGGIRRAVLSEILSASSSITLATDRLTVVVPVGSRAAGYLTARTIVRIDQSDSVYDEWKIVSRSTDDLAGTVTINATSIRSTELAESSLVARVDSDGVVVHDFESLGLTPTEHINTWVLPALAAQGFTWITLGTITPTAPIDLTFSWDTPLAALLRIAVASASELDLRRNGDTGYLIDLVTKINSSAQRADLRVDKNLVNLHTDEDTIDQATRVFPRGAQDADGNYSTMSRAQWKVSGVAGSVLTLSDPAGGKGPVQFDDQLNTRYLRTITGALTQVTDSDAVLGTVTVASATGIAVNDLIQFRADSTGTDMVSVQNPVAVAAYGVKVGVKDLLDVPGTNNAIKNPFMRDWPGTLPTNWSAVGTPTIAKQTAAPFTALGGASIKVTSTTDGQGVVSDTVPIFPTTDNPFVSAYGRIWVASGSARVEMILTIPAGTKVIPVGPKVASNSSLGQWEDLGVSVDLSLTDINALDATAVTVKVVQNGTGASVFYVDAGQATETPAQEPLVEGSGGTRLWQEANEVLRTGSVPVVSYSVPLVDLEQIDPVVWAESAVIIGAPVRARNARLGIDIITRILEINRDYLNPAGTSVVLSNKFDELTDLLAKFARSGRQTPKPGSTTEPSEFDGSLNNFRTIAETATERTIGWDRGAAVASVWAATMEFDSPLPADPWTQVRAVSAPLPDGVDTLVVKRPVGKRVLLIQCEPRDANFNLTGDVRRMTLEGAPPQAPVITTTAGESGDTGTLFAKVQNRGETVVSVQVQVKVGANDPGAWQTPSRVAGATSYVNGGTLGADEYEHDVLRDDTRIARIQYRGVLGDGSIITTDPCFFDRNNKPNIVLADGSGSVVMLICDADTKSVLIQRTDGAYSYWVDGPSVKIDLSVVLGNGTTGSQAVIGAGERWPITVIAYSLPRNDPDVLSSPTDTASVVVNGASASATAVWQYANVAAPSSAGTKDVTIALQSSLSSTYTTVVMERHNDGRGFTAPLDITSSLSPSLTAPPTSRTAYTWSGLSATYDLTLNENGAVPIEVEITSKILNGSGVVVATIVRSALWYYGAATGTKAPPGAGPVPDPSAPGAPSADNAWDSVAVAAPASLGSRVITITADAAAAAGTAKFLFRRDDTYGWTGQSDISALVSPAITTPPAGSTAYTFSVPNNGTVSYAKVASGTPVVVEIEAQLYDDASVLVATEKVTATWFYTDPRL